MNFKFLSIVLLLMLNFSCKSQKFSFDSLPDNQLVFGKGGGITGAVDRYTLLENGQLFHNNSLTEENKELTSISKKKAKKFYKELAQLNLIQQDINQPGNMYYFIEEVKKDTINKIIWGRNDFEITIEINTLYNNLIANLK